MSSGRRVRHLAERARLDPDAVLAKLEALGLPYSSPDQLVSNDNLVTVERAIGLRDAKHSAKARSAEVTLLSDKRAMGGSIADELPKDGADSGTRAVGKAKRSVSVRHESELEMVGHVAKYVSHLTTPAVLDIHYQLVHDFATSSDPIEPPGPRDGGGLLESALSRPRTSLSGQNKYPSIEMAGAALLHALVQDHPFHNGNKRTAIVALLAFLDLNGYVLTADEDELFDYVLALAAHRTKEGSSARPDAETIDASRWILSNSRKLARHQRRLVWRKLEKILTDYGCTFENRAGNKITVKRGTSVAHVGARNAGDEIDELTLTFIRKKLELDEAHGVDSDAFYYQADRIPDFINKYRRILTRLAQY